jgi:diguanylate cyclase (GGDEF)-like protein
MFTALLFSLFLLVGLSLAGSWELEHRLIPQAATSPASSSAATLAADQHKQNVRAEITRRVRAWTTAAQGFSMLLCGVLYGLVLRFRAQAARKAERSKQTAITTDFERVALERRVEERTVELRQEVDERRRAEEMNRGQKQVLEMLAAPGDLKTEDILRHLAETVAAQNENWRCSVHLLQSDGRSLRLAASSDVSSSLGTYLENVGAAFPDAPVTQACSTGQVQSVKELSAVRLPWSELLTASGIFSATSVPFRANASSAVAGTLTVFSAAPYGYTARELEMLETAAHLAALVIEHRLIHAELVQNAYHDALTGLPNRRAGEHAVEAAIKQASLRNESVAALWIDVNRFKRINDQYGHEAGDKVLLAVAERLRSYAMGNGTVARMGEDEFLVLLSGPSNSLDAVEISRRIGVAVAKPIQAGSALICASASIGISVYPQDCAAADTLQRNATFAMYRAKASGGGYCAFSLAMSEEANENLEIEESLSVAIEKNYLRVVYQPLYSQGGELTGFEALLRFKHPRLGEISPVRFIPIAEESRLIFPIGNWVLREACRQLQEWHKTGHRRVYMSVNISALQFARDDFADNVARIFTECNLAPEHLILELTESVVMEDYDLVIRQMNLLKQCGVRIAMDDFGTGYSSLSYIQRIPIDVLKIDRSFIEHLADPEGTRPIVEAVIAMARHLGLQVIAEGVETEQQQSILQQAGCTGFQGFLFARPLPPEQAENCLTASRNTPFANPAQQHEPTRLAVA